METLKNINFGSLFFCGILGFQIRLWKLIKKTSKKFSCLVQLVSTQIIRSIAFSRVGTELIPSTEFMDFRLGALIPSFSCVSLLSSAFKYVSTSHGKHHTPLLLIWVCSLGTRSSEQRPPAPSGSFLQNFLSIIMSISCLSYECLRCIWGLIFVFERKFVESRRHSWSL